MAVRVVWDASSGATRYTIYRSTTLGVRGQAIAQPTASPYLDNNVAASTTYYYSVSASNLAGESAPSSPQASVTTPANPPPPTPQTINSLTVTPNSITSGQTVTIAWSTSNATAVTLNGSVVAATGSTTDNPTANKSYTLVASGSVANIQQTVSVVVASVPPPTPQSITTFTVSPASITAGQSSTITWATANATLVRLNGITVAASGTSVVSPTANTNYTLLVSGSAPDISRTLTVTVTAAAQTITSFTASPTTIFAGTSSTLAWTTQNATGATINGQAVGTGGTMTVSPATTTVYTLVVTGSAAPVGANVTVTVQGSAQTPPQWTTVPDIVFTQGIAQNASLSPYVSDAQGDPFTLSVSSGTLPSGVTLNSSLRRLEYDGVGAIAQANNIILAADDSFTPPPTPTDYMVPTYQELAFGDTRDIVFANEGISHPNVELDYDNGASYKSEPIYRDGRTTWPGLYVGGYAALEWNNIGGDWKDAAGTSQGNTAYATQAFVGSHNGLITTNWNSTALTGLVKTWAGTAAKNYGLFLRANTSIIEFYARFYADATKRPILIVTSTSQGAVNVPCGRSQWLVSSSTIPQFSSTIFKTAGNTDYALVWFDLSAFPNAADITDATLRMVSYDQWGSCNVGVYAVNNPGDQSNINPTQLGVAASYPGDVGLAANANVLMFEDFHDINFMGTIAQWHAGLTRLNWTNDQWNTPGANLQGDWVQADEPGNGFTKLNGAYNAWKVRYEAAQVPPNQETPQPTSLDASWYPGGGFSQHIKPLQYCDELYFRYYLLLGNNYNPLPQGGKALGWTGRWTDIAGMGDGNGGSGCNGFTGFSARGGFGTGNTASTGPLVNLRGFDWYCYNIDQQGAFGGSLSWDKNYLGWLRKATWYSIEQRIKMNSVTGEHSGSLVGPPVLANQGTTSATATWTLSAPDPLLVSGNSLYISGVTGVTGNTYNGGFFYQVVDSTHIRMTVGPNAALPVGGSPVYKTGTGVRDGILQCWVNGRLAASYTNLRFRASTLCTDGTTPYGVEGIWLNAYMGGICYPFTGPFEYYISNLVVSKAYVGPMVT